MSKHLFSPLKLRDLEVKNRIFMSPMQQYCSPEGIVNDWHLVHLGSRAVGGVGMIISEATAVDPIGRATLHDAGIWSDDHIGPWKRIVDFVHDHGSKIAIQLSHFGSKGSKTLPEEGFKHLSQENGGWKTVSSSAKSPIPNSPESHELTISEIEDIQEKYVEAALRSVEAGFDAIEIHAAHGYLFHQFYSSLANSRQDIFGTKFENRTKFLLKTIELIRREIPKGMPVFVKISASDFSDDPEAWTIEDSVKLAPLLREAGVDLIAASAGGFVRVDKSMVKPGYQVPFAQAIRKTGIATGAVGLITEPKQANDIITQGKADVVVLAREMLQRPYFPIEAAKELGYEVQIPWQYKRAYL